MEIPSQSTEVENSCVSGTNLPHNFTWSINSHKLKVVKEHFHLGTLRSTLPSTANRTSGHINLGRSSFFTLSPAPLLHDPAPDPARDPTMLAWQLHYRHSEPNDRTDVTTPRFSGTLLKRRQQRRGRTGQETFL